MNRRTVNKVLVFACDVVPIKGVATSGGGMRSWQIIQGLVSSGFNVVYSIPKDRYLRRVYDDTIPAGILEMAWDRDNQDALVKKVNPDAIIFVNPDTNHLKNTYQVPLIGDLHGPRLIEHELMFSDYSPVRRAMLIRESLEAYRKLDFFTCAGKLQQHYFAGWFLLAGFPLDDITMHFMPVSLSPELPMLDKKVDDPTFIFSGGFYPWQDPFGGLKAVGEVLQREKKGTLSIYGGTHEINEKDTLRFKTFREELSKNSRVHFEGTVSRCVLLDNFSKGYVAVELMKRSLEREIAFTTRTIEFLWAGLPVIYNNYSELSSYIREYKAGWCVDPDNIKEIQKVCLEVLNNPEMVHEYASNAQRLVREQFAWDKTIAPLVEFLEHPVKANRTVGFANTPIAYIYDEQKVKVHKPHSSLVKFERFMPSFFRKIYFNMQVKAICASGLFDKDWYIERNFDVKRNKVDPVLHYVIHGWKEMRDPSPQFCTADYLKNHPELRKTLMCPLFHKINTI